MLQSLAYISWKLSVACQVDPMVCLTYWLCASGSKVTHKGEPILLHSCGLNQLVDECCSSPTDGK